MCCLALLAGFIGPRVALLAWWLFGDKVDAAFSTWVWPLLGLFFLPWTTLAYVLAWGPLHGVSGAGWLVVALGVAVRCTVSAAQAGSSSRSESRRTSRRTARAPRRTATAPHTEPRLESPSSLTARANG